jgi:hypothetical protein
MYLYVAQYKNKYRIFKLVETTIKKGLRQKEGKIEINQFTILDRVVGDNFLYSNLFLHILPYGFTKS